MLAATLAGTACMQQLLVAGEHDRQICHKLTVMLDAKHSVSFHIVRTAHSSEFIEIQSLLIEVQSHPA